ncbi:hypothetical protein ACLIBK_22025, partial [Roseomonas sp. BN140053]
PARAEAAPRPARPAQARRGTAPALAAARPPEAPPAASRAAPAPVPAAAPPASSPATPPAEPAAAAPLPVPPPPARALPPAATLPAPEAIPVRLVAQPGRGRALLLALPEDTGLAVLRRGDSVLAVLDAAVPLDLRALRGDPVFGNAEVQLLPDATVLRLRLAAPALLLPRRDGANWLLEAVRDAPPGRSILPAPEGEALALRAVRPGRVVVVEDPETGLPLLLGTVRDAEQNSPLRRSLPRAELLPTILGAALLARGDGVSLRAGAERFLLAGAGEGGAPAAGSFPEAAAMTRLFDLPAVDPEAAQRRLQAQQSGIVAAAPLQRATLRRDAAESLLALGLPQEAQAMLRLAFQEDPQAAADPRSRAAQAAAAILAGRLAEAAALDDATLPRTDETTLWRALLRAARGERAEAAPGLAATLPLLLSYPEALRLRLLAPAAEALLDGNETAAARRLLRDAGAQPGLDYVRGRLLEAEGKRDEALAAFEATARGRDRRLRARALRRSVELRFASGALDAAGAAAALEASLYAWRGDAEEVDTRLRVAALRGEAGDPRGAFDLLGETAALFPDRAAGLRPAQHAALLAAMAREAPLAAVALAEANRDLLAADMEGSGAVALLADRLVALDLPDRAAAVLSRAMAAMSGEPRAALGARLAALRLGERDAAGAEAALAGSAAPGLSAPLAEARAILAARALALAGQEDAAATALRAIGPAALPALADLLAARRDWSGAAAALTAQAALPGELDDGRRRIVVRAAAYAALAGDAAQLAALRSAWAPRLGEGALARAFGTLVMDPVRGLDDLPRLQRELDLFRGFPTRLDALRADAALTR